MYVNSVSDYIWTCSSQYISSTIRFTTLSSTRRVASRDRSLTSMSTTMFVSWPMPQRRRTSRMLEKWSNVAIISAISTYSPPLVGRYVLFPAVHARLLTGFCLPGLRPREELRKVHHSLRSSGTVTAAAQGAAEHLDATCRANLQDPRVERLNHKPQNSPPLRSGGCIGPKACSQDVDCVWYDVEYLRAFRAHYHTALVLCRC